MPNLKILLTRMSAKRSTVVIALALIIAVSMTALISSWILKKRAIENWKRELGNLSLILSESTSQTITSAYLVLDGIAKEVREHQIRDEAAFVEKFRDAATFRSLQAKISSLPLVDVASIVSSKGDVINFTRAFPAPPINLADRDYFALHKADPDLGIYISKPVRNRGTGTWTFYISRRIDNERGDFLGLVILGIPCEFFNNFFRNIQLDDGAAVSLYRLDYTLLARWPIVNDMMGKSNMSGATYRVLESGKKSGVALVDTPRMAENFKKVARMGAVQALPNYPLAINITITEDLYLYDWRQTTRLIQSIALWSILTVLAAATLMYLMLKKREEDAVAAQQLRSKAEAANEAKSHFLAIMSHEIRTPMHAVLGMTEVLQKTGLNDEQMRYAKNAHGSATLLLKIINEVLDFSKIESGEMTVESISFRPGDLMREIVDLHTPNAQRKHIGIALESEVPADLQLVGDPFKLRQIVGNLLDNAIKFSDRGVIAICYAVSELPGKEDICRFECRIADQGIGIKEEEQEKLFTPFVQANRDIIRKYGGTGLGLSICKRLVNIMNGEIQCFSKIGLGTTFSFYLIARRAADAGVSVALPAPSAPAQAHGAGAPLRVLLAEDGEMNRQLAHIMLAELDCEVDDAVDGHQAVEKNRHTRYDLILMDCMMPVMDGYEATSLIRHRETQLGLKPVPIIALTANATEGDRERCLAAGMDDYLAKPFSSDELKEKVFFWRELEEGA